MKDWPGALYLVLKSNPRVPGDIPLMSIGYKYNSRKVLVFIATEGAGITEPVDPYLSRFHDIYSNVSVHPVVRPHLLGRYFNACNAIYNHNSMRQSDVSLEKYWATPSGYFRLATTLALGIGRTDGKLLLCHGISEGSVDKEILTREYNNRTIYDCFNNPLPADCGSPALNLPEIAFDDRPRPHKRACYTPDLLPAAISVASENYFSTLTTTSYLPDLLPSDDPNTLHVMKRGVTFLGRAKIGYCCRKHDKKRCYKKTRFCCSTCSDKNKKFYYCHGFFRIKSDTRTCLIDHQHFYGQLFSLLMCLPPFHPLLYLLKSFLCLFSSRSIDHSLLQSLCMLFLKFRPCIFFIDCFNACDDRPVRQLRFTYHLHAYNRLLKIGMI